MKRQAENFHVVVGMTRLIKMPSYWFGDVLAVVFHIQKMFAEAISQPSSCFADVKLVTGGAPYAIDEGKRGNPHIGPIPIVIPLKLFLDLPRDPVSQEGKVIANHIS